MEVSTGVYFGWAVLEDARVSKHGRNIPHKAVVNVGYSPTFQGKENTEKIVEAHLMLNETLVPPDFYGETMRLQLHGYLRPEIKFPSFPDLIAQISADVRDASLALDQDPYCTLSQIDDFIALPSMPWVGANGGDEAASWEFGQFPNSRRD
jgi:riboflavin kinase